MPRTLSAEEYEKLGKKHYSQKQFQKAVAAFTNGIDSPDSPRIFSLYNYRAHCYDKLGDFQSALYDGRAMIREDETNVKVRSLGA